MKKNTSSPSLTENKNLLIEEREEVMVTKKGCSLSKTHFLKPFVTSIDGCSVAELPRREQEQRLSVSSPRISFSGVRFAQPLFVSWLEKLEALHAPTWRKAGIFEAIKASKYNIHVNPSMILPIAEKWCPETKTFVFPWGEATITLEDVMVLLEFSVLGSSVNAPLESLEMVDSVKKLERARVEVKGKTNRVSQGPWIRSFFGRGDQFEHEAFLALWISYFVFPDRSFSISRKILPLAVRLARGERIALAPAVLASLYKDLGQLSRGKSTKKSRNLTSLFILVRVWTWERFKNLRPEAKEIPKGEPRISRWDRLRRKSENVRFGFDDFEWRPYTKPLKNWNPLRFYREEAMWVTVDDKLEDEFVLFARCVRSSKLVGIGFVEDYYHNRVAMQFGLGQDLPGLVTRLHSNVTRNEAWDDYNKCLDGLKLYMPSRLSTSSVTARYRDWWLKTVSEFLGSEEVQKESTETFNARNTFDKYDDGDIDVSLKALPLIPVVQNLQEGFTVKRRRSRVRSLAKIYKIGALVNSLVSSGWKMNKTSGDLTNKRSTYESLPMKTACEDGDEISMDEEDVNMTISQIIRCGKKYSDADKPGGDASESLGKRSRRYLVADSDDDLGSCQRNALRKLEQRSEEDDETAKQPEKTRQRCDDVNGSNAEKKTMIDDRTKEAECWLHKDREKHRCIEKLCSEVKMEEDIDERLRQRKLAIKEIGVKLEARIIKVEKSLAKIRKWKTRPKMQFLPS